MENHYGENVWVHRKGAIRVTKAERAVIPGAMGSYSYVVEACRFAYKDIDEVMAQQTDLVTPVRKLKTIGVVKG